MNMQIQVEDGIKKVTIQTTKIVVILQASVGRYENYDLTDLYNTSKLLQSRSGGGYCGEVPTDSTRGPYHPLPPTPTPSLQG